MGIAERSIALNLAMIGALGWTIVIPTLCGVFAGRWLDHRSYASDRTIFCAMLSSTPLQSLSAGYGYSSLRSNFLCGFQICKPSRSTM
jgi:predicted F0F1-ATPase subunit